MLGNFHWTSRETVGTLSREVRRFRNPNELDFPIGWFLLVVQELSITEVETYEYFAN